MAALFEPIQLRNLTLQNRVCVSPMSQYQSKDGFANDWHFAHLSRFALGKCGLVFCEATAVSPEARRTPGDLGLWNDAQIEKLKSINAFIHDQGSASGIQLAHAGRKASERRPWHGETPLNDEDVELRNEAPWQAKGPTHQPYGDDWPNPVAMSQQDIQNVIDAFGLAAARAHQANFDAIEVYAAHGFLLHQFYSPLCNTRTDEWGGDFEGRTKLCMRVAESIRKHWPDEKPLFFRISATDWLEGGWSVQDSVALAHNLKSVGVDVIDCSSGGIGGPHPVPRFPIGPAFQADLAATVKNEADIATMSVGFIWQAEVANQIIQQEKCDLVALGRELLNNPNWALHAAHELKVDESYSQWHEAFGWWLNKRERIMHKLGLKT